MKKILIVLILIAIFFSGCSETDRMEMTSCIEEKAELEKANTNIVQANIVLEETKEYFKSKWETTRQIQLNDLKAMQNGLDGYANCHIATTCSVNKDYEYEFLSCSELTQTEVLDFYINSCIYSEAYNEFYDYVQEAEAKK